MGDISLNETISSLQREALRDMCRMKNNPMDIYPVRALIFILYLGVFTVAVTGNFLVVYVVMTSKRMQTVTNIFITNLAISDLLVNFTSLWLTPMYTFVGHWVWGGWLCHGLPLFQGTSIFISTLTLMAIAIDRYIVIVHHSSSVNINDRMSMRTCLLIVTLIWSFSLLLVMPYAVNMRLAHIQSCDFWICSEDWSDKRLKSVFGVVVMTLQFVVPFIIIGISYCAIWVFLNMRRNMIQQRTVETNRKKRLLRMLVFMVVLFAVCWFPFNLLNILRDLHMDGWIRPYFSYYFLLVHIISMTATCWNPILYAWMNESFRKEFMRAIPFLRGKFSGSGVRVVTDSKSTNGRNKTDDKTKETELTPTVEENESVPFYKRGLLQKVRNSLDVTSKSMSRKNEPLVDTVVEEINMIDPLLL